MGAYKQQPGAVGDVDRRRLKEHSETIRLAASRWPSEKT